MFEEHESGGWHIFEKKLLKGNKSNLEELKRKEVIIVSLIKQFFLQEIFNTLYLIWL